MFIVSTLLNELIGPFKIDEHDTQKAPPPMIGMVSTMGIAFICWLMLSINPIYSLIQGLIFIGARTVLYTEMYTDKMGFLVL